MKFRVRHTTRYTYGAPVSDGQNSAVVLPRNTQWQNVERSQLTISPEPAWTQERSDWFGNRVVDFAVESLHDTLEVTAESSVEVFVPSLPLWDDSPAWEVVRDHQDAEHLLDAYRLPSALIPPMTDDVREYARVSFPAGKPIISALMDLTNRIYNDFAYLPGSTEISTPVAQVFELRQGVCQDFAHFGLTVLRGLGLPARYVSGYLETQPPQGQPRLIGADASHAWFAVYIPRLGWSILIRPITRCPPTATLRSDGAGTTPMWCL